ncbi:YoaK family protein [Streptomyces sp. NPDC047841]|uniref:YoaK family protein n=1 Tax=Streptomyces sp. NPDC047841 TaxID=3154708 RepID=UPI003454E54E
MTAPSPDRYPWPGRSGAVRHLLTLAAGAANAFGFLALDGVFTSVVTANSALLGLRLGDAHLAAARLVAVALLGYVAGTAAGGLVAAGRGRLRGAGIRGGLLLEALLLWLVVCGWLGWDMAPHGAARTLLLFLTALAMGCQNGSVRVTAGSEITTAYLTGLLTSAVTEFATRGRLRTRSVGIVAALIAGAAVEGAVHRWLRPAAPLVPALLVTAALAATWLRAPARPAVVPPEP